MQHPLDMFLATELNSLIQGIENTSSGKEVVEEIDHFDSLSNHMNSMSAKQYEMVTKTLHQFHIQWERKKPLEQVIKGKNVSKYVPKYIFSR